MLGLRNQIDVEITPLGSPELLRVTADHRLVVMGATGAGLAVTRRRAPVARTALRPFRGDLHGRPGVTIAACPFCRDKEPDTA